MAGFHDYCFIFAHLSGIYKNLSAWHLQCDGKARKWSTLKRWTIQSPHLECYVKCMHSLFLILYFKVDTSRHRICFRWHYVLISLFAFLIAFHSSKFSLLPPPAQTARAAIVAQCRSREQFQSEGTPERVTLSSLLLQPGLNAASEQAAGGLFLDKVWKSTAAETNSSQLLCLATVPLLEPFLSLGPMEFSLTETCACGLLPSHCKGGQTLSPL